MRHVKLVVLFAVLFTFLQMVVERLGLETSTAPTAIFWWLTAWNMLVGLAVGGLAIGLLGKEQAHESTFNFAGMCGLLSLLLNYCLPTSSAHPPGLVLVGLPVLLVLLATGVVAGSMALLTARLLLKK